MEDSKRMTGTAPLWHRCISLWQPWASLLCLPHPEYPARSIKGFETRSWAIKYRGPLLIHAAKRPMSAWAHRNGLIREALQQAYGEEMEVPYGAIIGRVDLVECHPAEGVRALLDGYALAMGDYADGRFAWEVERPVLFEAPVVYRGQQGLFRVPNALIAAVEA